MKETWLIQRLETSTGHNNPFNFGGGLKNGGLTDESMDLLKDMFSFDYMGATEFEYGAIPETLQYIAENTKKYIVGDLKIKENIIYIYAKQEDIEEVKSLITKLAYGDYDTGINLKEPARLNKVLADSGYNKNLIGWLELDNHFLFTVDLKMFEKFIKLFEGGE